jgi:hypothetical protein
MNTVWISIISAVISLLGAATSYYWARRRMVWDAGRELGKLRADALSLIAMAKGLGSPKYSVGFLAFADARSKWSDHLVEKEPLLSSSALKLMKELDSCADYASDEIYGPVRIYSDNPDDEPPIISELSDATYSDLKRIENLLRNDPTLLSR